MSIASQTCEVATEGQPNIMSLSVKTLILFGLILVALFAGAGDLIAQPPPPTLPGMPDQAPIDGGLGFLAAAGGAYAWKKLRNRKSEI